MRPLSVVLLALLASCGGGGGGPAPTPTIEQAFSYGLVRRDVPTLADVPLANPFDEEATFELVEAPGGGFEPAPLFFPALAAASASRALPVTFTPAGAAAADAVLVLRVSAGSRDAIVRIALQATVETPTIALVSGDVDFGDVLVGESAAATVRVRNTSAVTPLQVAPATVLPADFSFPTSSFPLAPGETADLPLAYAPTAPATHDIVYTIAHNAPGDLLRFNIAARCTTWVPEIVTDFGAVAISGGETAWMEVDVPPHAISLHLEATAPGVTIGLLGFEGPGGRVYENDTATGDFLWFSGEDGVFTATLPSSDRTELMLVSGGGVYRFRFYLMDGDAASMNVRAIVHNRPGGIALGGVVDFNVYLADGLGISADAAPTHTRLQEILAEADRIFGQQGLSIGTVDYYVLTDPAFDQITSSTEFGDLLEESAQAGGTRLNLFFVEQTLGGGTLGVAARLSGPARNGTRVSGVMIDFDFGSSAQAGYVTAHESGHYLGLLHSTEQDGSHDLIDDTLECPATGTSAECATEGDDNLMHWRILTADPVITDGQALVLLGHPLVGPAGAPAPALAMRAASPLLTVAMPENWCGTPGCCGTPK